MRDSPPSPPPDLLELLTRLGTGGQHHQGKRTLLEHLCGTYKLLHEWHNTPSVCVAGLFHSIYGTEYYTTRSADLSQRAMIRDHIGRDAEELAYLFCACEHNDLLANIGRTEDYSIKDTIEARQLPLSKTQVAQLLEMEWANLLDLAPPVVRLPETFRNRSFNLWRQAQPLLSEAAFASLVNYFHPGVTA